MENQKIKLYNILEDENKWRNEEPKVIVTDMDETLCNIAPVCVNFMYSNPGVFKPFFKLDEPYTEEEVCSRSEYYLEKWLKRDEIEEVPKEIVDLMLAIFSRPDFYDYCQPTNFAKALKRFASHKLCKEIIILTHIVSEDQIQPKVNWLRKFFGEEISNRIKFQAVPYTEKKSKFIMENHIEWDSFADDSLNNIYDMILYAEGFGKEILIPKMGYNKPTERLENMVDGFNLQLFYLS